MEKFTELELEVLAKAIARSLTMPEVFEMMVIQVGEHLGVTQAKAAAVCLAAYVWYHSGDESLKDFLKDWIEDEV